MRYFAGDSDRPCNRLDVDFGRTIFCKESLWSRSFGRMGLYGVSFISNSCSRGAVFIDIDFCGAADGLYGQAAAAARRRKSSP